jgi:cellulose synthase/poly-beta-1,6-N-acetylglucosamine synthase-like glycosyltransferase
LIGLTLLTIVVLMPVAAVTAFFVLEVWTGLFARRLSVPDNDGASAIIVIPAHNEEAVIGRTVAQLGAEAKEFAILVIADNCTDRTAEVARAAGTQVIVRDEMDRRGKGFALEAARAHLLNTPTDVVIVIDADCRIDRDSLHALAARAARSARPCQAVNLLIPDLNGPPLVQLSNFAFMLKNLVRQRGLMRLSGRAHLTGTGMALPWPQFAAANLGGSNIVEDLALGLELAERAAAPMLVEEATVWSPAASAEGTLVQRTRWEGGYVATAWKEGPSAFFRSLARSDGQGLCAALDLCVPPIALLVLINTAVAALALVAVMFGSEAWPVIVQLAIFVLAAFAIALAWFREGRRFATAASLLRLPFYVIWKLPLYARLLRRGAPKEWLRPGR